MTPPLFALLVAAGVAAGLSGSIAGLASLFSYPALLAAGLPATTANVTNTVALAVSSLGSVAGSRPELVGQAGVARRLGLLCAVGGAGGAALLLLTPPGVFERIVPFLVAFASVALLARRPTGVPADPGPHDRVALGPGALGPVVLAPVAAAGSRRVWTVLGVLVVSAYGGYFGAAAGVLMLALLITALPETLVRANALKNLLLGLANVVAAVGFAVFGPVSWATALPLAVGLLLGSWAGPAVARRVPSEVLRIGIGLAGLGLAVKLGFDAFDPMR